MFPPGVAHPTSTHSSVIDLPTTGVPKSTGTEPAPAENASYAGPASASPSVATSRQGSREGSIAGLPSSEDLGATTHMLRDKYARPMESVYVYVTIQLYSIEKDFFLVDFKSAGYESIERRFVREIKMQGHAVHDLNNPSGQTAGEWKRINPEDKIAEPEGVQVREKEELIPMGRAIGDKRATSPFPFLDVASGLIIQLAEGHE